MKLSVQKPDSCACGTRVAGDCAARLIVRREKSKIEHPRSRMVWRLDCWPAWEAVHPTTTYYCPSAWSLAGVLHHLRRVPGRVVNLEAVPLLSGVRLEWCLWFLQLKSRFFSVSSVSSVDEGPRA